jgi:pyridoxine 4-dehydrogenase
LTGQIKSFEDIPEGDFRRHLPRFQPENFDGNMALVTEVQQLAKKRGVTPGQLAVSWLVALNKRPDMPKIIPIPGSVNVDRVKENAVWVDLTDEEMADIQKILDKCEIVGTRYPKHMMHLADG